MSKPVNGILPIFSYWQEGEESVINRAPDVDVLEFLKDRKHSQPKQEIHTALAEILPKRLAQSICDHENIKVEPVKGQMLIFSATPGLVNRVVLNNGKYVIPRRDGLVVTGSTLEYCGFERITTEQATEELAAMAIDIMQELASGQVRHHWSGFRPGN